MATQMTLAIFAATEGAAPGRVSLWDFERPPFPGSAMLGSPKSPLCSALGKTKPIPESSRELWPQKSVWPRVAERFRRGSSLCEHWVDVAGPALRESCLGVGAAPLRPPTWGIRRSSLGSRRSEADGSSLSQWFWQIRVHVNIRVSFSTSANSCSRPPGLRWAALTEHFQKHLHCSTHRIQPVTGVNLGLQLFQQTFMVFRAQAPLPRFSCFLSTF